MFNCPECGRKFEDLTVFAEHMCSDDEDHMGAAEHLLNFLEALKGKDLNLFVLELQKAYDAYWGSRGWNVEVRPHEPPAL